MDAAINNGDFLSLLKLENVIPPFTNVSRSPKDNHRQITFVKNVSKTYKIIMLIKIGAFMESLFQKRLYYVYKDRSISENLLRIGYIVQSNVLLLSTYSGWYLTLPVFPL